MEKVRIMCDIINCIHANNPEKLTKLLKKTKTDGIKININQLIDTGKGGCHSIFNLSVFFLPRYNFNILYLDSELG